MGIVLFSQEVGNDAVLDVFVIDLHVNRVGFFDDICRGNSHGRQLGLTEREEVGLPTSVDVLVSHAEVVLAGLLTTTNPLHTVLPPLDVTFQEDPSVTEEIVLGKVSRVFGVGARLVHAYETLGEVDVSCPFAVGKRQVVSHGNHEE